MLKSVVNRLGEAKGIKCIHNKTIKNLPASERPYEKFLSLGASGLSDADLLAIIIKTGTRDKTVIDIAQDILSGRHGNLLKSL